MKANFSRIGNLAVIFATLLTMLLLAGCGDEVEYWDGETNEAAETKVLLRGPTTISFPKHPGSDEYFLDWCRESGANCGKKAAEEFCWQRGFYGLDVDATTPRYARYDNIAQNDDKTKTIGSNEVCTGNNCDGFWYIRCGSENADFEPKYGVHRVDYCKIWGDKCGQEAADEYCKRNYTDNWGEISTAMRWVKDNNIGEETKTYDGKVCRDSGCDSFKYIQCTGTGG